MYFPQLVGVIVDHSLDKAMKNRPKQMSESSELWRMEYPDDPFEVEITPGACANSKYVNGTTNFSYDIIAAADRQKEFFYQVL